MYTLIGEMSHILGKKWEECSISHYIKNSKYQVVMRAYTAPGFTMYFTLLVQEFHRIDRNSHSIDLI